jgi:hypothetical protein
MAHVRVCAPRVHHGRGHRGCATHGGALTDEELRARRRDHKGAERSTPGKVLGDRANQRTLATTRGGDAAGGGVRQGGG